jgi:hypothetical protein
MNENQEFLDDYKLVEEPTGLYQPNETFNPNSLRISSFESLEEENRKYSLSLKPIERWKYLHQLNLNAFGKETKILNDFGKTIFIK